MVAGNLAKEDLVSLVGVSLAKEDSASLVGVSLAKADWANLEGVSLAKAGLGEDWEAVLAVDLGVTRDLVSTGARAYKRSTDP